MTMKTSTIEKGIYQGYLWMSDATEPIVLNDEPVTNSLDPSQNPFIIEGQLYDKVNSISYSIKYADGKYLINSWNLNEELIGEGFEYTEKDAVPNPRMLAVAAKNSLKIENLYFRQYWHAEEDALCEGMKVLKPHALVFVGFKTRKEDAI